MIAGGREAAPVWTPAEVEERLIVAMKLDHQSPRLRGPRAPGSAHPTVEYTLAERVEREGWDLAELKIAKLEGKSPKPEPLLRHERQFMDTVLSWFAYLADEKDATRRTFAAWLRCKAVRGIRMRTWQDKHGVGNGSVKHAKDKCIAAIAARLAAEGAVKLAIPTRFDEPLAKAA